ncbi:MAG: TlpA disulfide reductase family protein [Bermanella sp.]
MKILILIFSICFSTCFSINSHAIDVGDQAPDFELKTLKGDTFKLASYRGRKPVYLVFWATWCPICRREIPNLKTIYQELGQDIEMLAINVAMDEALSDVMTYRESHQIPYPLAFDEGSVISRMYGVIGTPWQVMIDINGVVRFRSNKTPENLSQHIQRLSTLNRKN